MGEPLSPQAGGGGSNYETIYEDRVPSPYKQHGGADHNPGAGGAGQQPQLLPGLQNARQKQPNKVRPFSAHPQLEQNDERAMLARRGQEMHPWTKKPPGFSRGGQNSNVLKNRGYDQPSFAKKFQQEHFGGSMNKRYRLDTGSPTGHGELDNLLDDIDESGGGK